MNQPTLSSEKESGKNLLLFLIVLTSFINPFMGAAVNIALPEMAGEFSMNAIQMGWVSMSFLLASAAVLLPFGKIADIRGRKMIFLYGNIVVMISSLLCALSGSSLSLIIYRVIQGVGGAMMFATGTAMITSVFPPHQRGRALGINVSAVYLGLTLAPLLGGIMTDVLGWRSIFWLNVPFGLFMIPATILAIKSDKPSMPGEKFDLYGSVIYIISISLMMYGFSHLPGALSVALSLAGLGGLIWFVKYELRLKEPVVDIRLFTGNRTFGYSNLAALINYAATFAVTYILSLYLQYIKGLTPSDAGMLLVTQPIMMTLVASFSGRLSDKLDPRFLSSAGMGIIVVGLTLMVFVNESTPSSYIIASLAVLGAGFGMFSSPNTNSVMSSVEKQHYGVASASIGTMRLAGQMISMAIATMVIHAQLGDSRINPSNHIQFIHSIRIILIIFVILCIFGVFASLARGKKGD